MQIVNAAVGDPGALHVGGGCDAGFGGVEQGALRAVAPVDTIWTPQASSRAGAERRPHAHPQCGSKPLHARTSVRTRARALNT